MVSCTQVCYWFHVPNSAARLTSIKFDNNDILKIIRSLNVNKAHGHDGISVRMIKMCDESLVQPLSLIFRGCIDTGVYPDTWKKSNIVPVHKKGDKQIVNNYRPVSLLPICSKILEKMIFNSIMRFLNKNKLLNDAQSGFRPSDSWMSATFNFSWHLQIIWLQSSFGS